MARSSSGTRRTVVEQMKEDFLETLLHGESQVHVTLFDFGMRLTRLAEQLLHAVGKMSSQGDGAVGEHLHSLVATERLEIIKIELEAAILRLR